MSSNLACSAKFPMYILVMISKLLSHKIRKDLLRDNKKHNHRQYLRALTPSNQVKYWSGYHKKKLLFLAVVSLISWNYDLHISVKNWVMNLRSPKQLLLHLFLGSQKVEGTVNQQNIVGWQFGQRTLNLLTRVFYQTDKRLIFGVGRNYLFQVYSSMGLLQKPEDAINFWRGGGFHKKKNQLVSGVSYKQFIDLYSQSYKALCKTNPEFTPEQFEKQFLTLFVQRAAQIQHWQREFNRVRYSEYLKNLLTDSEKKVEEVDTLMKDSLDIRQPQIDQKLQAIGMKGMGLKDQWTYWRNRQVLMSLRQYSLHKRLNMTILQGSERMQLQNSLKVIQNELGNISQKKQKLKQQYLNIYEEDLI